VATDAAFVRRQEDTMAAPLIAVVNHEATFLRLMDDLLRSEGYETLTIPDGGSAYEVLKRDQPVLVIIDTWLGARDQGLDLIQLLKLDAETASIPILVVSSDDKERITEKLANPSGDGIELLFKPFEPEDLITAIKNILNRHHA
jgi:DNA-binding response OmpR family regulator